MTPFGLELRKDITPFKDKESLEKELNNLECVIRCVKVSSKALGELERVFCRVKDIRNTVSRVVNAIILDDVELYEIKYFSMLVEEIIAVYKELGLSLSTINFISLKQVIDELDPDNKKIQTFYIYESYSERLKEIRAEKRSLEEEIFKEKDLDKKARLKNDRLNIVAAEEEEELTIRRQLTQKLSAYADEISKNMECIGKLDFLTAKAKLALRYNAAKPNISEAMDINFKDMFNPEISELLERKHKSFTPIDIELNPGTTVITGANMGGKSVAMKTIVLNLLLGQCGFYVFARLASFPMLGFVYFISDDLQSVSQGLSTFGAEIVSVKQAIEAAKYSNGLIVLDEFARGTNPKEGFYLVKSLCKYLNSCNSISVVSTHYDGVVQENMMHYQVVGLKNLDFNALKHKIVLNKMKSIDIIQEYMDYRLEKATREQRVPKDALNISILLGLQEEIIDIAKEYYES
jgi:dsDNA-specific endonuclease/ATPase MutS2